MRQLVCAALVLGASTLATSAGAATPGNAAATKPQAVAAHSYAVKASARELVREVGYSRQARRRADCLATYPGYDPRTDRIIVGPGVTRRCTL